MTKIKFRHQVDSFLSVTKVLKMKRHLAVFDLDETLTTHNGSHEAFKVVYADGILPANFAEIFSNLDKLKKHMIAILNERNLSKDEVWDIHVKISQNEETLIEGMDKVVEFLFQVSF